MTNKPAFCFGLWVLWNAPGCGTGPSVRAQSAQGAVEKPATTTGPSVVTPAPGLRSTEMSAPAGTTDPVVARPAPDPGGPNGFWNCPLPVAAEHVDETVTLRVTVGSDGTPAAVVALPPYPVNPAFVDAARECVMQQAFLPALDRQGHPIAGDTAPIKIRYLR